MAQKKKALRRKLEPDLDNIPKAPLGHRGSALWSTNLTEDDVRMIRAMHREGWTVQDLSAKYKTTWHTMNKIVKRLSWKHVADAVAAA